MRPSLQTPAAAASAASGLTFAQALWPAPARSLPIRALRAVALAVVFSLLIGVCAHIAFYLPGERVPYTMQTFAVLLTGALLGARLGTATLALYLIEGVAGLPVFAPTMGTATYGYLVGFLVAACVVGALAERGWDRSVPKTAAMMIAGSLLIYVFGALWLSRFVGGVRPAILLGVTPFVVFDAAKAAFAAVLLPAGWRLLGANAQTHRRD